MVKRQMIDMRNYRVAEKLRTGLAVTIRAIRSDDKARLVKAFEGLERESVYTRLFRYQRGLTPAQLARIDSMDFAYQVTLVVTIRKGDDEKIISGGSYIVHEAGNGIRTAEIAFTVEEDYQGLGIAGRVLEHLVAIARSNGIERFDADVLSTNEAMLRVFERSGLPMTRRLSDDTVHVTLALGDAQER